MAYSKDLRERRLFKVYEETVRAWVKAFEYSGKTQAEPPPSRPRKGLRGNHAC